MTEYIPGHKENPAPLVKAAFEKIAEQEMKEMPFIHPGVKVEIHGFEVYEDQWVGVVLTPWMMSALILPGPDQEWPVRKVSHKLGLKFPRGDLTFVVGEIEGVGQYLTCSLMSPLDKSTNPVVLSQLAQNSLNELLTAPEADNDAPKSLKRRFFLFKTEK